MEIILASQSPRRRELLSRIGWEYTVHPSEVEEVITSTAPVQVVQELSSQKAMDVAGWAESRGSFMIIGADTIVVCDETILGKPKDEQNAIEILGRLQGRAHSVYTGVTVVYQDKRSNDDESKAGTERNVADCKPEILQFVEETRVHMYPMDPNEIRWYVSTGEPMDKAGAYGIQGLGARFIRCIEGDYQNVVGLPVARLYQEIKNKGWNL